MFTLEVQRISDLTPAQFKSFLFECLREHDRSKAKEASQPEWVTKIEIRQRIGKVKVLPDGSKKRATARLDLADKIIAEARVSPVNGRYDWNTIADHLEKRRGFNSTKMWWKHPNFLRR